MRFAAETVVSKELVLINILRLYIIVEINLINYWCRDI